MARLPDYRGFNVMEWSLFYNDVIGVTLHMINTGIDTGDIICFKKMNLKGFNTINSLRADSIILGIEMVIEFILNFKIEKFKCKKQLFEEGKQYYKMHKTIKRFINQKLNN